MLDKKTIDEIKKLIFSFINPREAEVFIFGSRAAGGARKFSDIDIGIKSNKPIPLPTISIIKEKLEESDIPYTVDVIDFSKADERFKDISLQKTIHLN